MPIVQNEANLPRDRVSGISELTPDPRSLTPGTAWPIVRNEPNLAKPAGGPSPWRAKNAKRSQLEECQAASLYPRLPMYPIIPVFHYSTIPIDGLSRQTKPIPGRQNGGKMCETNPIWAEGAGTGGTERAKRSQFPAGEIPPGVLQKLKKLSRSLRPPLPLQRSDDFER